jgi:hypothetical protein
VQAWGHDPKKIGVERMELITSLQKCVYDQGIKTLL